MLYKFENVTWKHLLTSYLHEIPAQREPCVNSQIACPAVPRILLRAGKVSRSGKMKEGVNPRRADAFRNEISFMPPRALSISPARTSAQIGDARAEIRNPFRSRTNDLAPCNPGWKMKNEKEKYATRSLVGKRKIERE